MNVADMSRLVNEDFQFRGNFDVDLCIVYGRVRNILFFRRDLITTEASREILYGEDGFSDLQATVEQIISQRAYFGKS